MSSFSKAILVELESVLVEEHIQTLTSRSDGGDPNTADSAVKVVHVGSGVEVVSSKFDTQIENKAYALAQLMAQLKKGKKAWQCTFR